MRIVLAIAALCAAMYAGFRASARLKRRAELIRAMACDITKLGTLMEYKRMPLAQLARSMAGSLLSSFWGDFASGLDQGKDVAGAWNASMEHARDALKGFDALEAEELRTISDFGASLGMSASSVQQANISLAVKTLNGYADALEADYLRKGKMYRSLGVLCGMAAALLLI